LKKFVFPKSGDKSQFWWYIANISLEIDFEAVLTTFFKLQFWIFWQFFAISKDIQKQQRLRFWYG